MLKTILRLRMNKYKGLLWVKENQATQNEIYNWHTHTQKKDLRAFTSSTKSIKVKRQ